MKPTDEIDLLTEAVRQNVTRLNTLIAKATDYSGDVRDHADEALTRAREVVADMDDIAGAFALQISRLEAMWQDRFGVTAALNLEDADSFETPY